MCLYEITEGRMRGNVFACIVMRGNVFACIVMRGNVFV